MFRRLEYILFISCVLLLTLLAPLFLFAVQDRISNQTVYAENQELTISATLTNNYIENNAERMSAYLVSLENGAEYQVVELDSRLNTGEVLELLRTAFHYDELSYGMIDGGITSQVNTQYAICSAQDASDIMFLVTCITLLQHGGSSEAGRLYRILVDSQTGSLYFFSIYYKKETGLGNSRSFSEDLFSDTYGVAYQEAMDEFFNEIEGLSGYTCYDLLLSFVDWYGSEGLLNSASNAVDSHVDADIYSDLVYFYADQAIDPANMNNSAATRTTLTMRFPSDSMTGDLAGTVQIVTQFGNGDITTGGTTYNCRICMGIEDFAEWIPRFGYIQ